MTTIAEQSSAIAKDVARLHKRDSAYPVVSMLGQWSAELSILHRCQVIVTIVPVPGTTNEVGLVAYPLLSQEAIASPANQALAAVPHKSVEEP